MKLFNKLNMPISVSTTVDSYYVMPRSFQEVEGDLLQKHDGIDVIYDTPVIEHEIVEKEEPQQTFKVTVEDKTEDTEVMAAVSTTETELPKPVKNKK